MKTTILTILALLAMAGSNAQTRHRVNNSGATGPNVYSSISNAQTAAVPNDILIVDHADLDYDSPIMTKKLTIYGPGYFLAENLFLDSTQADPRHARSPSITFNAGSSGSIIQGMTLNDVIINTDNITISRCKIEGQVRIGESGLVLNPNINQNFIEGNEVFSVHIGNATNYVIANNLLRNDNPSNSNHILKVDAGTGLVLNNIFFGEPKSQIKNASVQNNLFFHSVINEVTSTNITVDHNLSNELFLSDFYGGITNFNYSDQDYLPDSIICFSMNPSPDVKYRLETNTFTVAGGNPAVLGGADGKDMGMFGGALPYKPSGMPPIPSIWFYQVQSTGTQGGGVQVTVKAKSRT
ncbi:MAG: hypothetical protein SH856_09175 [Flavobacteriales bacterium]|nr:hypothetical protein [Flavobacteriales bacterium]